MKNQIEFMLIALYVRIGIGRPSNHDHIVDFVVNDVTETAIEGVMTPINVTSTQVHTAFRRFLESIHNGEY